MAYLTIVDQVMPYHGKVLNLPQTKNDCLKNILLTAINLFQTPRLDFFIAIVRYSFNGQIFDFSRKITSMYYFSNLAYAYFSTLESKPVIAIKFMYLPTYLNGNMGCGVSKLGDFSLKVSRF